VRVLLLTQVLPYPPDSGPKIKTLNVIKYLASQHDIILVSFVRGDQSADVKYLSRYCREIHTIPMKRGGHRDGISMLRSMIFGQPWTMVRDHFSAMAQLVDRVVAKTRFDIVHTDQLNMAQYGLRVHGVYRVLDTHNALWLLYERLAKTMKPGLSRTFVKRDCRLLKQYEGRMCREFDAVLAVSRQDADALEEAAGVPLKITVVPITVDTEKIQRIGHYEGADHILHMGTMFWPPNVDGVLWFCRKVFPLIREKRPNIVIDVVGSRPPRELRKLGEGDSGIKVIGYVRNPGPYLQRAGVIIVPLRAGGGMRVKILYALAQGIPVVSTRIGSEGIAVESGKHLIIADTAGEFAESTLHLIENPDLCRRLAQNGRELIKSTYDYRIGCRPLNRVYGMA
jgi:glycosyltransferase involved in cell wall biosynthesis